MDSISAALAGVSVTADIKQRKTFEGNYCSPSRRVPNPVQQIQQEQNDESLLLIDIKNTDSNNTPQNTQKKSKRTTKMEETGLPIPTAAIQESKVAIPLL
jgi:hypothetical protein